MLVSYGFEWFTWFWLTFISTSLKCWTHFTNWKLMMPYGSFKQPKYCQTADFNLWVVWKERDQHQKQKTSSATCHRWMFCHVTIKHFDSPVCESKQYEQLAGTLKSNPLLLPCWGRTNHYSLWTTLVTNTRFRYSKFHNYSTTENTSLLFDTLLHI